jgi:hypothetical protein
MKFYTFVHKRIMLTVFNEHGTESTMHTSHFFFKHLMFYLYQPRTTCRADIWRWDCILAWSIILSVHGADPIVEVKLLISLFLR